MTNRIFVVADTHFGHKNVISFEAEHRPFSTIEEHDEELVYRWNNTVKKHDTVWHLGDVAFSKQSLQIVGRLNGNKKLVMGNHDMYPSEEYLKYFTKLYGAVQLKEHILTHIPVHPSQLNRFKGNIHGHLHSEKLDDPRYVCVSIENTGLVPVLLDTVIQDMR